MNKFRMRLSGLLFVLVLFANMNIASASIIDPAANGNGCCASSMRGYWFETPVDFTLGSVWLNTVSGLSTSYNLEILEFNTAPPLYSATTSSYSTLASFNNLSGIINLNLSFLASEIIGILAWDNNLNETPYSTEFAQTIDGNSITLNRLVRQSFTPGGPVSSEVPFDIGAIGFSTDSVSAQVPEPASIALLGLGLAAIGFSRRKKSV